MRYFTLEKINRLLSVIQTATRREEIAIPTFKILPGDQSGMQAVNLDDSVWQDFTVPGYWGGYDQFAWFRAQVPVPAHFRGRKIALRLLVGPRDGYGSTAETLVYVNGQPVQTVDVWHEEVVLPAELLQSGTLFVALYAWAGVLNPPPQRRFKHASLCVIDTLNEQFYHLAHTLAMALPLLDENDLRRVRLEAALNDAFHQVDFIEPGSTAFYQSIQPALALLQDRLKTLQRDEVKPTVIGVGHSHIDLAWLWQMQRTRQKAIRTFTTVLNLMRQYPEYYYSHSTPQLYQFVQQDDPELYARVKAQIQAGRWEVLGGSWVEMDTLIPSGESLVRQVLFGKRFARREFGADPKVLWLPDSFGFTALLPTILRGAGIEGFFTAVVSYSRFNRFPYDTFRWRAPDGSEILVNFITTPAESGKSYNYIGRLEPYDTKQTWDNNRQKEFLEEVLLPFGWGDGGGGPTVQMLEQARAMTNLPGIPYVKIGKVEPFFTRLKQRLEDQPLPLVDGEIYLENLRGAYTSQASTKRANRKAEVLYHDAEWLSSLADMLTDEKQYPQNALNEGWQIILRNQFHDILSGTSITPVHADSLAEFAQAALIGAQALQSAQQRLARQVRTPTSGLVVFNPTAWARSGVVQIPWRDEYAGMTFVDSSGNPLVLQHVAEGLLVEVQNVPSMGYACIALAAQAPAPVSIPLRIEPRLVDNGIYQLQLNAAMQITSLRCNSDGREVLADGEPGNQLQLYEDRPLDGEAWQIEPFYQEKLIPLGEPLESVVEEAGPLRGVLRSIWRFNHSTITQRMILYVNSPRIDFETEIDWHEHQVMLKAAFPVQVRARQATYDIGFASLERPTHWNTPFDAAHFENPAHKWVDLSEYGFGVALLNDCKYGCDVKDHTLRLTLHRSPTEPDPAADQGVHRFTYSLLPHTGDWRTGGVVRQAYELNDPLQVVEIPANPAGALPASFQLVECSDSNVVIDTIKKAEDDDSWVIRLFEAHQKRSQAVRLEFGLPISRAVECTLLEEELHPTESADNRATFTLHPFEVKTFKVWLRSK